MPHKLRDKEDIGVPIVVIDYGYTRDEEGKKKDEIKYGGKPMLVVKDKGTGYITANLVPRKGADPFALKSLNRDIGKLMGQEIDITQ